MIRAITRLMLFGAGALLGLIGASLLASPKAFLEMSHVVVERDPGLMSELAAPSGVLILTSALLLTGAFKLRYARLALVMGTIVYGSYGSARLASMILHGLPSQSLITAMMIELIVAIILGGLGIQAHPDQARFEARNHTQLLNS